MVAESGMRSRPRGGTTIAPYRDPTAHTPSGADTAAAAARHGRTSDQQPALPRHLADRRSAAPDRRLQRRAAGRAAGAQPAADLRRRLRDVARRGALAALPEPRAGHLGLPRSRALADREDARLRLQASGPGLRADDSRSR